MATISSSSVLVAILVLILSAGGLAVFRLLLNPIAHFPGPKFAALTGWYETYFDCFQRGRYWAEIEKMHEKYGNLTMLKPSETCLNSS